jgi:hypothetical protein
MQKDLICLWVVLILDKDGIQEANDKCADTKMGIKSRCKRMSSDSDKEWNFWMQMINARILEWG